jgi:hypothetical protein
MLRLGDRVEGEGGDRTRTEEAADGRAAILEITELLALGDRAPSLTLGSMTQEEISPMPIGINTMCPIAGSSAMM